MGSRREEIEQKIKEQVGRIHALRGKESMLKMFGHEDKAEHLEAIIGTLRQEIAQEKAQLGDDGGPGTAQATAATADSKNKPEHHNHHDKYQKLADDFYQWHNHNYHPDGTSKNAANSTGMKPVELAVAGKAADNQYAKV